MLLLVTGVQRVCSLLPKMLLKLQAKEIQCMEKNNILELSKTYTHATS